MSLKPEAGQGVPETTARVAHKLYAKKGNIYLAMHDELSGILSDDDLGMLYAQEGKPGVSAWRVGLACLVQFMENLTDAQTVAEITSRIDLKYLLEMELEEEAFDKTVLSKFRQRLVRCEQENLLLEKLLDVLKAGGYLQGGGKQRTDGTFVTAAIRQVTRLECVGETLRHCLEALAVAMPDWLKAQVPQVWYDRYGRRFEMSRLPKKETERSALATQIGQDGQALLTWLEVVAIPEEPAEWVQRVALLKQIWNQQYQSSSDGLRWRTQAELPPCEELIQSPYDAEARYTVKRDTGYLGYKTHLTETCSADHPHLIVNVLTTPATQSDVSVTPSIHQQLDEKALLPDEHCLDSAYLDSTTRQTLPQQFGVTFFVPVRETPPPLSKGQPVFGQDQFLIDYTNHQVHCPAGQCSTTWSETTECRRDNQRVPVIKVRFARDTCQACPLKAGCTTSQKHGRSLQFFPEATHHVLQTARQHQQTPEFKDAYRSRAGIEGTFSALKAKMGLGRTRYIGLAKTHLQAVLTACATNIWRWFDFVEGVPLAQTRVSAFRTLAT